MHPLLIGCLKILLLDANLKPELIPINGREVYLARQSLRAVLGSKLSIQAKGIGLEKG